MRSKEELFTTVGPLFCVMAKAALGSAQLHWLVLGQTRLSCPWQTRDLMIYEARKLTPLCAFESDIASIKSIAATA